MQPLFSLSITKYKGDIDIEMSDIIVGEIRFDIVLNGEKLASLMATPVDLKELAIGYLMSENIINSYHDIESIDDSDEMTIKIEAKVNSENFGRLKSDSVIISGCGRVKTTAGSIDSNEITSALKFRKRTILDEMSKFYNQCELYEQTGCVHTAKFYIDENHYFIGEDIAQHNSIDKAIGKAIINGADLKSGFLMVSGRLSSEMVAKAVINEIPLLVSRTAPTYLGVMIARKFNLTLCGFARGENINVYSGQERIYV